ncbi:MAG: competence/damage-inducible protein A [Alphaproteobacteria bacterium]
MQPPTACLIIIGNEILSGRTQDKNLSWLGEQLNICGIRLMHVCVIPDLEEVIVDTVNACRSQYRYVFTTGGIGPTHDDITSRCIAKAFGLPFVRNPEAQALLEKHYGDELNEERLSMADMPEGAKLIYNPVSSAPGFIVENVYVMAGVPRIMQAMFMGFSGQLEGGVPMQSHSLSAFVTEGSMAKGVGQIQDRFPDVEIGSYPFLRDGKLGTTLVARSTSGPSLQRSIDELRQLMLEFTDSIEEE